MPVDCTCKCCQGGPCKCGPDCCKEDDCACSKGSCAFPTASSLTTAFSDHRSTIASLPRQQHTMHLTTDNHGSTTIWKNPIF
ncbi:hypothetical protein BSL78_05113 [Apostichopus japonicus]|uniref:Metallothionein n=1 Tax=Stichopus japonicus TaxID=307972 RepID=A0A2G8LCH4_STIJA|nr:hypothetical protein BSL78_05113 [Apostichopus japonicus]